MQSLLLVQVIFSSLFFAAVFESQASSIPHSARLHRRFTFVSKATPSNWSTNSLEDYDQYHFRFLSIGCHKKRDQEDFFKECCHPRQKNETLENIPVECQLDPQSMVKAQEYILNSTLGKGEVESGIGRPVYVPKDSIKVLQPEKVSLLI
ncbi:expressed protein [Phakopsora pachyrhizi]|uniref:Expressed protein n=1 Tax=Phakopsora pachyrhizi TaxID=170000 RepID=A0AAV0AQQ2_PHAPC|nr:expressed protein [Phakopsora pachyrhizi]